MLKLAIIGASGRMGQNLLRLSAQDPNLKVVAAIAQTIKPVDQILKENFSDYKNLNLSNNLEQINKADLVIDFSNSHYTTNVVKACFGHNKPLVIGTTGLSLDTQALIDNASQTIAICQAANFSIGVNLMLNLVAHAAKILHKKSDIEIHEAHHRHKLDAPSGTAIALAKSITAELDWNNDTSFVYDRTSQHQAREDKEIGFSVTRAGEIIGEHSVIFANGLETIKIEHIANDRKVFAQGALDAAQWLLNRPAGLYSMKDVLELN